MSGLKIPYGIDSKGRLCSAERAKKGEEYFCPVCSGQIILKRGKVRRSHFAHKPDSGCSQETVVHKTAKLLIQEVVRAWKAGKGNPPILLRECDICGGLKEQKLPEKVEDALLEYRLSEGVIVDVGLLVKGRVQAAVEVKVTHEIDEEKLRKMSIPFIEVDGNEIIENPYLWKSLRDTFNSFICEECKDTFIKFQRKARRIARKCNIELPKAYYRYGITVCWKCKKEIIVFAWPEDGLKPGVKPYPRTIRYCYSRTMDSRYWANTCPYCGAIQGNFFLYMEPDGPFFGLNIEEDSIEAFKRDMLRIAFYAGYI